jgi:hypothetical protein
LDFEELVSVWIVAKAFVVCPLRLNLFYPENLFSFVFKLSLLIALNY